MQLHIERMSVARPIYDLTYVQKYRLWSTLVEQALVPGDRNSAFRWFTSVLHSGGSTNVWQLISKENSELLLMEKISSLDPAIMSTTAYDCFAAYFKEVFCC